MHTHLLRAAMAAVVVLLPFRSEAQSRSIAAPATRQSAQEVVGKLLAHGQELSPIRAHVGTLTALANGIRADRGRLQIAGFDRVPGKLAPRSTLEDCEQVPGRRHPSMLALPRAAA